MSHESAYLRSVDFNRNVVPLRCPLGVWSHFKARSNQVDAKLALKSTEKLFHIKYHVERNV